MCFEGKWLENRLRADKCESRSLLAVDIQGHQRGGFCIVPVMEVKVEIPRPFKLLMVIFRDSIDLTYLTTIVCNVGPLRSILESYLDRLRFTFFRPLFQILYKLTQLLFPS